MRLAWYKLTVSKWVTRYWFAVIVGWVCVAIVLKTLAPNWSDIAADGDLAFLPKDVPSSIGQRALHDAFPGADTRSQMVLVVANETQELQAGDLALALDLTRRLHWFAARSAWQQLSGAVGRPNTAAQLDLEQLRILDSVLAEVVRDNLTEAIEIDEELTRYLRSREEDVGFQRLPDAYQIRSELLAALGERELALADADTASLIREEQTPVLEASPPDWAEAVRDVWSWRNAIVGHKLASGDKHARLIAIHLGTEFTATGNIQILGGVEQLIQQLRAEYAGLVSPDLRVEVSGSAAVGADMLRAAASGVKLTEMVTIVLVLLILALVYRAPFLVAIPLTSIALSLILATSVVALLARDPADPGSSGIGVFTTTRIFIVVLLFGAGTDFCLFFLARSRELLQSRQVHSRRQVYRVIASGWRSVHDALVASAATTIVGLALMWFSRFEKFQFSGPIIAISLAVTLLVCLTFTPALLSGIGRLAFWPLLSTRSRGKHEPAGQATAGGVSGARQASGPHAYWELLANRLVARPWLALVVTLPCLVVPAAYGVRCLGLVTYDLTEELSENAPSRRGAALISQYFPTADGSPVTILLKKAVPFESEEELREACSQLSAKLYLQGVDSVRSLTDPLGDYPPGKRMGLFDKDAWRRRILLSHRLTKERYVSSVDDLSRRVAKFDLVLHDNPFSIEASGTLRRVRERLNAEVSDADSEWDGAEVTASGTTVGITDLRQVTQSDQRRIQILVTLGVWLVLVLLLRQWVLSTYLIFTVLLSYFATLGITYWTFASLYGAAYSGLDWKVPLFLFVILVAVGQDYNVYLVTRIFEEQRARGLKEGVRRALMLTGGIITSCGFVMAGTFVAMTSPAILQWLGPWLPASWSLGGAPVLRGITELGFALALGVLLDTLVVRTVLVPTFVLLWRPQAARAANRMA